MLFKKAGTERFYEIRDFYWTLIDSMQRQRDKIGWEKGIYPSDEFIKNSLAKGELYTLSEGKKLCGCVILNSDCNQGYEGVKWSKNLKAEEILIPHALAVDAKIQKKGIGKILIKEVINTAKNQGKKAVRLDILGTNTMAEKLYTSVGFEFVDKKEMFYEDTGWTEYKMFELNF